MIDSAAHRQPGSGGDDFQKTIEARIARAVRRARAALVWERVWPLIAPFLTLAALFAALSWFGLWRITATPVRIVILALFAVAIAAFAWRVLRFAMPTRAAAFARVEQATGVLHRPATAFSDRLASRSDDPTGQALWAAHRRRTLASLDRLRAGIPAPRLAAGDPYALRFLVLLLFVVGFIMAGPERIARIGEAFRGGESTAAAIARIDAWVTPPAYTGRPPIFLTGEAAKPPGTKYSVPVGSVVTVRTGGTHDLAVMRSDGTEPAAPVAPSAPKATAAATGDAAPPLEHQVTLTRAGSVTVEKTGHQITAWNFAVEPDNPPKIALVGEPHAETSGALALGYSLQDDYGVVAGRGEITPLADPATGDARPLYKAPELPLSLPQTRVRNGTGRTIHDLTAHPWAGAKVKLTLVATDEAKQEGRSAPVEFTLPARSFTNPLARAVVEQRAKLALDANAADRVADALDAFTVAPDRIENAANYLALRSAYFRLVHAHGDDELRGVVDYLWSIALGIEDGNLSLAAQSLRDAQDALRKALENNASDQEIQKLTENLRQAMQQFLQALADQARQNPQANNLPPNANVQTLRSQDLEHMLDRIENLARTGARDAARQMLSELQNMLESLQAGQPQNGQQNNKAMQSLNQLGDMIRKQEELMNRTYRADQGQNPDGSGKPMTKEQMQQALRDLQQQQQALQQSLGKLMQQLQGMGLDPTGKLDQAGQAMGSAEGSLGKGQTGPAVGSQGQALDALRQGAQGLNQQLANRQGRGQGGGVRGGDNFPNQDPLGRPQHATGPDLGTTVKVPDEIDTQRAREVLDAIRRRLGDSYRPQLERDYLERLLEQF